MRRDPGVKWGPNLFCPHGITGAAASRFRPHAARCQGGSGLTLARCAGGATGKIVPIAQRRCGFPAKRPPVLAFTNTPGNAAIVAAFRPAFIHA